MHPRLKGLKTSSGLNATKGLWTSSKTKLDRWMKEGEVLALLSAARNGKDPWAATAYDALAMTVNLALRVSECVDLRLQDFDSLQSHNAVQVRARKKRKSVFIGSKQLAEMTDAELIRHRREIVAKTPKEKTPKLVTVFLGDLERNFIATVVERRRALTRDRLFPFTTRYLQYLFNYYRAKAGLRVALSPHALRRFCATRIEELTGSERMAEARLRHVGGVTRESYLEFPPEKQIGLLSKVRPVM